MKPMIDPDFSALIPPLSQDEYKQLEKNILKEGIRHNLVVWEGILLDGHNRLRIALKHGLTYGVDNITLKDRDAAQAWMVDNQLGRRNLTPAQRDYLLGLRYRQEKKSHGGVRHEIASGHTVHLKTAEQMWLTWVKLSPPSPLFANTMSKTQGLALSWQRATCESCF